MAVSAPAVSATDTQAAETQVVPSTVVSNVTVAVLVIVTWRPTPPYWSTGSSGPFPVASTADCSVIEVNF